MGSLSMETKHKLKRRQVYFRTAIIFISVTIMGIVASIYYYQSSFKYVVPELVIRDYERVGDDEAVVIDWRLKGHEDKVVSQTESEYGEIGGTTNVSFSLSFIGSRYVSNQAIHLKEEPDVETFSRNIPQFGEYWKINVYNLKQDPSESKEYDLFKIIRNYDENYVPYLPNYYSEGSTIRDKDYQVVFLRNKDNYKDRKIALFDLATGKIVSDSQKLPNELPNNLSSRTSLFDYYSSIFDGVPSLNVGGVFSNTGKEGFNSLQLSRVAPHAVELMTKYNAKLYIQTNVSEPEKLFNTWQLLLPEGQNIFDNLVLYGKYTKDGQDHEIRSVTDFETYYNGK